MTTLARTLWIIGGTGTIGGGAGILHHYQVIVEKQEQIMEEREEKINELENQLEAVKTVLAEYEEKMQELESSVHKKEIPQEQIGHLRQSLFKYGVEKLAFLGFTNEEEYRQSLISFLYEPVLKGLYGKVKVLLYRVTDNYLVLVEREPAVLKKLMVENKLELSEITKESACGEICKILGVDAIVVASIGDFDDSELYKKCDDVRMTILSKDAAIIWTDIFYSF